MWAMSNFRPYLLAFNLECQQTIKSVVGYQGLLSVSCSMEPEPAAVRPDHCLQMWQYTFGHQLLVTRPSETSTG